MYHVVYSQYYNFDIAQLFVQKQLTQWTFIQITLVQQCPPPLIFCAVLFWSKPYFVPCWILQWQIRITVFTRLRPDKSQNPI